MSLQIDLPSLFSSQYSPETLTTLALLQLPKIGCARYWQLIRRFGSVLSLLQLSDAELDVAFTGQARLQWRNFCSTPSDSLLGESLRDTLKQLQSFDIQLLAYSDSNYPELLRQISKPPALLYLRGDSRCLELPQIGVVGSRRPTPVGVNNATSFAQYLSRQGFAITSGLALGIDAAAHSGALSAGAKTLAVLGTGLDCIYPSRHQALADKIVRSGGLLVSEFPLGTQARPGNFPQRNRIISGLSLGVLVVEAAVKSGSLITARLASEQGREVFALPGSIHCPVSRGCNGLIRQGATLVESAEEIVDELHGLLALKSEQLALLPEPSGDNPSSEQSSSTLTPVQQQLLDQLGYDTTALDVLAERTGLAVNTILSELVNLELLGVITQVAGGYLRVK